MGRQVRFGRWLCDVVFRQYGDGSTAIILNASGGQRVAVATVALDSRPPEWHVFIKTWSENVGMLEAMVAAGVLVDTGKRIACGQYDAQAAICRLVTP